MIFGLLASGLKATSSKKPEKKIDKEKLLPSGDSKEQKALPAGKTSSAIVKRSGGTIQPRTKSISVKTFSDMAAGGRGGIGGTQNVYESLSNKLSILVKNTNALQLYAKNDYQNEIEERKAAKKSVQVESSKEREQRSEKKAERKQMSLLSRGSMPGLDIFKGVQDVVGGLVFGTAVMEAIRLFNNPQQSKAIFGFLEDNMLTILTTSVAVGGGLMLAGLIPVAQTAIGLALGIGSFALSILGSPAGIAAIAAFIAAATALKSTADAERSANRLLLDAGIDPEKAKIPGTKEHEEAIKILTEAASNPLTGGGLIPALVEQQRNPDGTFKDPEPKPLEEAYGAKSAYDIPLLGALLRRMNPKQYQEYLKRQAEKAKPKPKPEVTQIPLQDLKPANISSRFGQQESFRRKPHEGVDQAVAAGTPLSFKQGGKVIDAFRTSSTHKNAGGGYGQFLKVELDDGKYILIAHLSKILSGVRNGMKFEANQILAESGGVPGAPGSGRSGGAHIHLEQHQVPNIDYRKETLKQKLDPVQSGGYDQLQYGGNVKSAAAGIEVSASYETPYSAAVGGPSLSMAQQPRPTPSNAAPPVISGGSTREALNKYHTFQVLGALYKQG